MTINASKLYRKFRGGVEFGISVFDQVPTGSKIWQKVHYKLKIRCSLSVLHADHKKPSLTTGFEPVRAEPNGFQVHRLNHSATSAVTDISLVNSYIPLGLGLCIKKKCKNCTLPTGFEPVRAEPNGFRVHRLNHSATTAVPYACKLSSYLTQTWFVLVMCIDIQLFLTNHICNS